jgi:lipoprotein-releasing system permease protein
VSYEWFVASRYLRAKGRSRFRLLITLLAVGGVALGVAAAIIVFGVMDGFGKEVRSRIVGTNGHVILLDPQERGIENVNAVQRRVEQVPGVVATAPFIFGKIMLSSERDAEGALLRGMDRAQEELVTEVPRRIFPPDASFAPIELPSGEQSPGIVLGVELSTRVRAGIGETVVVSVPTVRRHGIPRLRTFVVTGLFESGMFEYDATLALTSLAAAREALGLDERTTGILVRVDDMDEAPAVGSAIMEQVEEPPLWANDWIHQNRQLFLWMKIEKLVGYLLFAIILVVAAFLIASTLIMIVLEKTREIGVLRSLGVTRRGVSRTFLLEGMAIGGLGTACGCGLGWLGCVALDRYRLPLPGDVYFIETLPVSLWWGDLLFVAGMSLLICLAATLYPAWRASRLAPVEAIRYE